MTAISKDLIWVFSGRIPEGRWWREESLHPHDLIRFLAMKRAVLICVLSITFATPAAAHPVPFSFLDLQLTARGMDVSLVIHDFDLAHELSVPEASRFLDPAFLAENSESLRKLLLARLQISADGSVSKPEWDVPEILPDRESVRFLLHYPSVQSKPGHITIHAALFPYDPLHQTFVNIYEDGELMRQFILDQSKNQAEHFTGSSPSASAVIRRFVPEGIHHILIGPDHILFLIGLLLLGGSPRRLLAVVTSFTVAHSLTLSLAALRIVHPSPRIIEPAIALSIVYVGLDNLLVKKGRDVRTWIAFCFGFIHGFGFANVLHEMDLPRQALGWSLFSFNFGVEIGQLIVVLIVASLLAVIRSRSETAGRYVAAAGSVAVIIAGAFWFTQRVFF
jgi:hydrogenase/urease accessory protein HupE